MTRRMRTYTDSTDITDITEHALVSAISAEDGAAVRPEVRGLPDATAAAIVFPVNSACRVLALGWPGTQRGGSISRPIGPVLARLLRYGRMRHRAQGGSEDGLACS